MWKHSRVDGLRLIQYLVHITQSNNCAESDHKVLIHMKHKAKVDELIKGWHNFLISKEQQFSNLDSLVEQKQELPGQFGRTKATLTKKLHRTLHRHYPRLRLLAHNDINM